MFKFKYHFLFCRINYDLVSVLIKNLPVHICDTWRLYAKR